MIKTLKILFLLAATASAAVPAVAGDYLLDCRVGMYYETYTTFRYTRLTFPEAIPSLSCRIVNGTYNGMGYIGNSDNYLLGIQGVFTGLNKKESKLGFLPFAGITMSESDFVNFALSLDAGFDFRYSLLSWMAPVAGASVMFFNGSTLVDYYLGPSFSLKKSRDRFSFDILFSCLYVSGYHNIWGTGARLNFLIKP